MKKIITTVGTSLFSNFQQDEVRDKYGRDYASISIDGPLKNIENKNPIAVKIYEDEYKHYIRSIKENIEDYWFGDKFEKNKRASAEIASILKIAEEEPEEVFEVHLVATDTLLSVLAAEMIGDWFKQNKSLAPNVQEVLLQRPPTKDFKEQKESDFVIKDLRVDAQNDYEKGFLNLIEVLDKIYTASKKVDQQIVLNVTGGYKAIIPVMTLYGQLRKIPLKYIYNENESTKSELITIENLPVNFDWGVGEMLADYIADNEVRAKLEDDSKIIELLRNYKIIRKEDKNLTIIGALLGRYVDERMFEGKTSFGFFAEYKVYEALIEDYNQIPKRGKEYWWDKNDQTRYSENPMFEKNADKETRIEIDLVSTDEKENQTWYEVKPSSKTGINKAYQQIQERLLFLKLALKSPVEKFILILYKFDFQRIEQGRQFENLKKLFDGTQIEFEVWYFDVPVNFDKEKINNKVFFEQKIELHRISNQSKIVTTVLNQ